MKATGCKLIDRLTDAIETHKGGDEYGEMRGQQYMLTVASMCMNEGQHATDWNQLFKESATFLLAATGIKDIDTNELMQEYVSLNAR